MDWNIALDTEGGPNWQNNFVDSPIIVNASNQEYYKQPSYYALGHFSKFLSPGSVRVGQTESETVDNFQTTTFVRPDGGTVVIALNLGNDTIALTINDSKETVSNLVKPNSIQTYLFYNYEMESPSSSNPSSIPNSLLISLIFITTYYFNYRIVCSFY